GATQAPRSGRAEVPREEMSEIQAILEGREHAAERAPVNPAASSSVAPALALDPRARMPRWWRDQIADLADAAQRIDLGARALRAAAGDFDPEAGKQLDALDGEVARLVQFARTLACLAAPPVRGEQTFDLAEMLQL